MADRPRTVVDLFAGPGGWDLAAHRLDLDPIGIEWDDAACATRRAAGLNTVQADVSGLDPGDFAPCWGLIASPPCQAFSMAGKGTGRAALDTYRDAIAAMMDGEAPSRTELDRACNDPRAHLVLEPLRWILALQPRWITCEQVEPVLPLWETMASALTTLSYCTWAGVLSAEQYGVPQTRRRAILIASLDITVTRPRQTHQTYVSPRAQDEPTLELFDAGAPQRITIPEEAHLKPWVSMAEALGWTDGEVGFPRRIEATDDRASARMVIDGVEYRERDVRPTEEPSFALTEKTRSWVRFNATSHPSATNEGRAAHGEPSNAQLDVGDPVELP